MRWRRPSHIDSAGGVDCRPAGGLADGEETAYAMDQSGAQIGGYGTPASRVGWRREELGLATKLLWSAATLF
jgi:hypothetical protein